MSDYRRLTERCGKGICIKETSTNDNKSIWNAIERLAELEDKIENGTLIELPCKVGDTVYKVEREYGYSNDTYFWNIVEKPFELGMLDYWWGKMIFLTKAEAEARLRGLKENDNDELGHN